MNDHECISFLQWCLPRLRMQWAGFRKVRRQVRKRIARRMDELKIGNMKTYQAYLEFHPDEWPVLDSMCRITISRFYRDRGVFDAIGTVVLPELARTALNTGGRATRLWSAGCASGEEAYTCKLLWDLSALPVLPSSPELHITATDMDDHLLGRAAGGIFRESALKDLPEEYVNGAFEKTGGGYRLLERFRKNILFIRQDIRERMPGGPFHMILCRNLVFTYFEEPLQAELLGEIADRLINGGLLVTGMHESLPKGDKGIMHRFNHPCIYRKSEIRKTAAES